MEKYLCKIKIFFKNHVYCILNGTLDSELALGLGGNFVENACAGFCGISISIAISIESDSSEDCSIKGLSVDVSVTLVVSVIDDPILWILGLLL